MKEGDDFASVILQITHRAANLLREIFLTGDRHAADGIRFQMLPDQFVGVAVWRIRRQKKQAQFRTQRLHESADFLRTMSRATIDDQKDFALGALDQAFQEFDEDIGVDAALVDDHEPQVAARGDRRNQTHAMASARRLDDGRVAFRPPCPPRVMIGADVRRVAEIDVRPLFFGHRLAIAEPETRRVRPRDAVASDK